MIDFFPPEPVLLRTFHSYQLHLTSKEKHLEARRWFDSMGFSYEEKVEELKTHGSTYLRWTVMYLEFTGHEIAVAVRLRWT